MANENKWSSKPIIEAVSQTTEICILDGSPVGNKRISAENLLLPYIPKDDIVDNLTSEDNTVPLSANQGKVLDTNKQDKTDNTLETTSKNVVGAINELKTNSAPKESPAFTGNPTAPTPVTSDNDTSIATTAYVKNNLSEYIPYKKMTSITTQPNTPAVGDCYYHSASKWMFECTSITPSVIWSPISSSEGLIFRYTYDLRYYTHDSVYGIKQIGDLSQISLPVTQNGGVVTVGTGTVTDTILKGTAIVDKLDVEVITNNIAKTTGNEQKFIFVGTAYISDGQSTIYGINSAFDADFIQGDTISFYMDNSAQMRPYIINQVVSPYEMTITEPASGNSSGVYFYGIPFTGTVETTNLAYTITGSGTNFLSSVNPGDIIRVENGEAGAFEETTVIDVVSDTVLVVNSLLGPAPTAPWSIQSFATESTRESYLGSESRVANNINPMVSDVYSLGTSNFLWSDIWLGTAPHVTSDARKKTTILPLTADELNASKQIGKEIGTYKLLSAIYKKGNDARLHIGITVQKAIEIMEANNLDPFAYGFICYDSWDELTEVIPAIEAKEEWVEEITETTYGNNAVEIVTVVGTIVHPAIEAVPEKTIVVRKAGDAYSLRYEELIMFLLAGLESRISALEDRV